MIVAITRHLGATDVDVAALLARDPYCDAHLTLATRVEIDGAGNVWRNCEEC